MPVNTAVQAAGAGIQVTTSGMSVPIEIVAQLFLLIITGVGIYYTIKSKVSANSTSIDELKLTLETLTESINKIDEENSEELIKLKDLVLTKVTELKEEILEKIEKESDKHKEANKEDKARIWVKLEKLEAKLNEVSTDDSKLALKVDSLEKTVKALEMTNKDDCPGLQSLRERVDSFIKAEKTVDDHNKELREILARRIEILENKLDHLLLKKK